MFPNVISCSFLVTVVSKASLTTVLNFQFISCKLSLIPLPLLWRITSQKARKFQLVRVKQQPTLLSFKAWVTWPAVCRCRRRMQVFQAEFSVHVTFTGMFKCFSVYQTAPMIKNDLALAGILPGFLLDFEWRMVFLRFFLPSHCQRLTIDLWRDFC